MSFVDSCEGVTGTTPALSRPKQPRGWTEYLERQFASIKPAAAQACGPRDPEEGNSQGEPHPLPPPLPGDSFPEHCTASAIQGRGPEVQSRGSPEVSLSRDPPLGRQTWLNLVGLAATEAVSLAKPLTLCASVPSTCQMG